MAPFTESADSSKALGDLLCVADPDGRLRQVTPSFALVLGSAEPDVLGRLLIDLVHPGDVAATSVALHQLSEGTPHVEFHSRLLSVSGRGQAFAWHATADPETHLVFAVAHREQDAAADRRMRKRNNAGIAAIVETAVDGIISIDEHGVMDTVNGAAATLFGYTDTELIGQNVSMLMPSPSHDEHDGYLKRYLDTGHKTVIGLSREVVGRRKDGATVDIELSVNEMKLGGQRMFTGILRDISQRKKAEQILLDRAARIAVIAETTTDGIFSIDEHGVIDTVNGAAGRLFGYTAGELIGQNVSMLMPPPAHDEHDGYLKRYLDTGHKTVIGLRREFVGRRKDGATIDIEVSVNEVKLGRQRTFTGVLRDISQRKKIEQALAERAAALTQSNMELQQFAYVASHDLQEPLRKISSYLDVLSADYADHLDDQAREYIGFAVDGAQRMRRMIVDLLAVSQLRVDMMTVGRCDTGDLVRAIVEDYALAIADAGAVVIVGDLPVVQADRAHLRQAFQNLISNAIKYRGTETLTLHISAQRHEEGWLFTVADNGIGFKQEYAEKAFRMFQRLVGRRAYEGTGMGLAIVAKVVENHGGRVWAESQPGVGTTFFFTVPGSVHGKPLAAQPE